MTVREMIQELILNCNLDDHVRVEVEDDDQMLVFGDAKRVFHVGGPDNDAIIECHDR